MLQGRGLFLVTSNHPSVLVTILDAAVIDNAVTTGIVLRVITKQPSSPLSYHSYLSRIIIRRPMYNHHRSIIMTFSWLKVYVTEFPLKGISFLLHLIRQLSNDSIVNTLPCKVDSYLADQQIPLFQLHSKLITVRTQIHCIILLWFSWVLTIHHKDQFKPICPSEFFVLCDLSPQGFTNKRLHAYFFHPPGCYVSHPFTFLNLIKLEC
jgi:hypothetical protein